MKRFIALVLCLALVLSVIGLAGCTDSKSATTTSSSSSGGGSESKSASTPGKSKVFSPDQLLTADDVSKIVGVASVKLDTDSLKVDSSTGESNTYYVYDVGLSTIYAMFELKQNGAVPAASLKGNSAEDKYNSYYNTVKKESEELSGIGDKAFWLKSNNNVFVLYKDYFFMVGFRTDDDSKDKDADIAIAKKVVENIKSKQ